MIECGPNTKLFLFSLSITERVTGGVEQAEGIALNLARHTGSSSRSQTGQTRRKQVKTLMKVKLAANNVYFIETSWQDFKVSSKNVNETLQSGLT
jgi:hypothetical protein